MYEPRGSRYYELMSNETRLPEPQFPSVVINISGPEGNAFMIIGVIKRVFRQAGLDFGPVREDMMSGDYAHLLEVARRYVTITGDADDYEDED